MPRLKLIDLKCNRTEDLVGADEPYFGVNGSFVWGPGSLNNGQSQNLLSVAPLFFFGTANVQLFDQDNPPSDPDDPLGVISVSSALNGAGPQDGFFTGDGANYALTYEVIP